MNIELLIWSNGDDSVGIKGCNHKVTLKIDPMPDFDEMEENDVKFFKESLINNLKSSLLSLKDYFDCDFKVFIATADDLLKEAIAENEADENLFKLLQEKTK